MLLKENSFKSYIADILKIGLLYIIYDFGFIIDGNQEIGARIRRNFIISRHLIRSRAVTNQIFFLKKIPLFLHACAECSKLPFNISIMSKEGRINNGLIIITIF